MSPTTTASADTPRAIVSSSELFPVPGAPKIPTRAPRPSVSNASIARTPVHSGSVTARRVSGAGAVRATAKRGPRNGGPPSKAFPPASMALPNAHVPRASESPRWSTTASVPRDIPSIAPCGATSARPPANARTVPASAVPSLMNVTRLPIAAPGASISSNAPRAPTTTPQPLIERTRSQARIPAALRATHRSSRRAPATSRLRGAGADRARPASRRRETHAHRQDESARRPVRQAQTDLARVRAIA